jgi:hypothetical protein
MKQYIDKSTLVAEIERRKQDAINNCGGFKSVREHECDSCIVGQYEEMEEILNTLEVKEVNLEKEYKDFVEEDPVYNKLVNGIVGKAIAKHFFELGMSVSNKAQKGE